MLDRYGASNLIVAIFSFIVKNIIDNIVIGLCNEFYDGLDEGTSFPNGTAHDMNETLEQLTTTVESHSYYQIGLDICEVCDNAPSLSQVTECYQAVNSCGTGGYEECVEEKLCDFAISTFASNYGLTLSQTEKNLIKANVSSCGGTGFEKEAIAIYAALKHDYLQANYQDYAAANINIEAFIDQYGADVYVASAIMYEAYMDEIGEDPEDPYQWQLAMEVFQEELLPILLEFTPGIGDLIGAYNDFSEGNYFWGCVGIVSVLVPGDEIIKVIRKADNIRDAWKNVKKVFTLWNKLFTTAGGQKVLNKMPQSWKELPGSKLANNGKGLKWNLNSGHHFRLAEANPNSQWPSQHVPYAKFFKDGSFRDINMNPVSNQSAESHIPIDDLTDSFLNTFFN